MEKVMEKRIHKIPRSTNFSSREVSMLLAIVKKYKHIVMCKRSGEVSAGQKRIAWEKIEMEFNSCPLNTRRSWPVLKKKFQNMKQASKAKGSGEPFMAYAFGEGPWPPACSHLNEHEMAASNTEIKDEGHEHVDDGDSITVQVVTEDLHESLDETSIIVPDAETHTDSSSAFCEGMDDWSQTSCSQQNYQKTEWTKTEPYPIPREESRDLVAEVKAKWTEAKLKKKIELMQQEHDQRLHFNMEKHYLELSLLKEKHALEIEILKQRMK